MKRSQLFRITFQGETFTTCDKKCVAYYKAQGATIIKTGSYVKSKV